MEAFDKLPYELRRAIDACPWGVSAHFCEVMIRHNRLTAWAATERIMAMKCRAEARDMNYQHQRVVWGQVLKEYL